MCCRSSEAFPERWPNRQADRAAETLAARDALDVPTMLLNETDLLQARAWTAADSRRSPRRPAAVLDRHAGEARKGAAAEQHVARLLARCEGAATPAAKRSPPGSASPPASSMPPCRPPPGAPTNRSPATSICRCAPFLRALTGVVDFGADPEAAAVPTAMKAMPTLLEGRRELTVADIDTITVSGSWKHLVFGHPPDPGGAIDTNAYVFCVLTQFHRQLKRRGIDARLDALDRSARPAAGRRCLGGREGRGAHHAGFAG